MENLKNEMISAMKSKDKARLSILRLINGKVTEAKKINPDISDEDIVKVLDSMVKERGKSIEAYLSGNNTEAADAERYEITVIEEFLPKRLSLTDIENEALKAINESGASSMKDMGKVIGILKSRLGAEAKPADIAMTVKKLLS